MTNGYPELAAALKSALDKAGLKHDVRYVPAADLSVDGEIEFYLADVRSPIVLQLGGDMIAINRVEFAADGTAADVDVLYCFTHPAGTEGIADALILEMGKQGENP